MQKKAKILSEQDYPSKEVMQKKLELDLNIWLLRGMLVHNYKEEDLKVIFERYQSINMVPDGYNYPELATREHLPEEMQEMLERKAEHFNLPNKD